MLSALLMACDELVLFLEVICLTLPLVEFMFEILAILPVDELAPRFCFPLELLVACDLLAGGCLVLVPAVEPPPVTAMLPAAVDSADFEAAAVYASCLCVTTFMIRATSMNLG